MTLRKLLKDELVRTTLAIVSVFGIEYGFARYAIEAREGTFLEKHEMSADILNNMDANPILSNTLFYGFKKGAEHSFEKYDAMVEEWRKEISFDPVNGVYLGLSYTPSKKR